MCTYIYIYIYIVVCIILYDLMDPSISAST